MLNVGSIRADEEKPAPRSKRAKAHIARPATRSSQRAAAMGNAPLPTRDDRNSREVTGGLVGGANGPEYRVPTGSHLPQRYHRRGYTTDSDKNSFIFDRNDQRLRSHDSVGEALRSVPGLNVTGPRGF